LDTGVRDAKRSICVHEANLSFETQLCTCLEKKLDIITKSIYG
jgi:hypothetical protein